MRTPLHINLLLHYHCYTVDWPQFQAPAVQQYLGELKDEGLIEENPEARIGSDEKSFLVTDKGRAHVEALCRLPYPECRWVTPKQAELTSATLLNT